MVPGRATLVPGPRLTLSLRRGAAERAHAPCGGAGGGDSGRGWAAPVFWGLGAVGGAGSLTVVTTAPPPPRLAGLWTVIAFGGRGALAVVSGNSPPLSLCQTPASSPRRRRRRHARGGCQIPQKVTTPRGSVPLGAWLGATKMFLEVLGVGLEASGQSWTFRRGGGRRGGESWKEREGALGKRRRALRGVRCCSLPPDAAGPDSPALKMVSLPYCSRERGEGG